MAKIHLLEGPVGAGKSTYGKQLSERIGAVNINLDAWMAELFMQDRPNTDTFPWYLERKKRCLEQIWKTAVSILNTGSDVILELGLIQQTSRTVFYSQVDSTNHKLTIYVLDVSRKTRLKRVQERNLTKSDTFSMEVSDEIFHIASDMWEPMNDTEYSQRTIIDVSTSKK